MTAATALEPVLASIAIFEHLRPDEISRIARRCKRLELADRERHAVGSASARPEPQLVIVVAGEAELEVDDRGAPLRAQMAPGDRFGTYAQVTGEMPAFALTGHGQATLAILDRDAFAAVLAEFPAVALPLASELAREVSARDDFLRQLLELHAAQLPEAELDAAIAARHAAQQRRGARITRGSTRGLFRRLVADKGAEPPFWMLIGFLGSLGGARLVVHLILKYHLESQLFALVPGTDPNPMHVHHFNYGLILIGTSGLLALRPLGRRALSGLALMFGLGAGLVFDEFALIWRLNPEYAQSLSIIAAGVAAAALIQVIYFRHFWRALVRRAWLGLRGAR